jgi:drug/metabolite transporter (DMT)-like permease
MNKPSHTAQVIAWMLVALSGFSLLAIASRELTAHLTPFEILFWRSAIGIVVIGTILARQNPQAFQQQNLGFVRWHFLRNLCHFGGQCAWLFAIAVIPLAELFALEFTTPLWAALIAMVFLGEKLNLYRLGALMLGLLGVLVILRPGVAAIHPASLVMLVGAIGFAISVITTRHITKIQHDQRSSVLLVLFYMVVMHTCFAGLASGGDMGIPERELWPWILMTTLSALAAHFALTKALTLADAAVVLPIDYLRLPLITVIAWWLYDEPLSWQLAAGAALIIGGNALSLYGEKRQERKYAAANNGE